MKYFSTKRYGHERGYSIAYRQWKADSHCRLIHGYAIALYFEFESDTVDVRNWVADFGGFKTLKAFFDDIFDHTLLVARDDPEYATFKMLHEKGLCKMVEVEKTGCEGLSEFLYEYINDYWLKENGYRGDGHKIWCRKVQVFETPDNSAGVEGHEPQE
jgi:6-pyruvoyltetrahydropterin/6-carboxytetrahydropterin synthase